MINKNAESWKGKYGQLISELFAVGTEITPRERIVETLQQQMEMDDLI